MDGRSIKDNQRQKIMNYDEDKVDDFSLALLYLVSHGREEGCGAWAWKGFDWDTLNRLHEKGLISNPIGKAKSVGMTEEGFLKAEALFEKYFMSPSAITQVDPAAFPKLTAPAKKRWNQIPEKIKKEILNEVWCANCRKSSPMQLREGAMDTRCLVLRGTCKRCGGDVARLIEPAETII